MVKWKKEDPKITILPLEDEFESTFLHPYLVIPFQKSLSEIRNLCQEYPIKVCYLEMLRVIVGIHLGGTYPKLKVHMEPYQEWFDKYYIGQGWRWRWKSDV